MQNLFANIPAELPREVIEPLLTAKNVCIERILSRGQTSPPGFWYDQAQHEWVLLVQGAARLEFPDRTETLGPGDYLHIPAHQRHRVAWTSPEETTVWLAVFYD
jgi:cupin 2 domain-containing protein